jgi:hypothetical protein
MRTSLLLAMAALVWFGSWSTGATPTVDTLARKGGRTAPGFYVAIQGKLVALPTPAWLREIGVDYVIQADRQQIFVSCGTDKTLLELLSKVGNRLIRLNGTLAGVDDPRLEKESAGCVFHARDKIQIVNATRFEEVKDPDAKDELTITAVGNLHPQLVQLTIAGPPRLWEIVAGRLSLSFSLMDSELLKQAAALEGNEVVAMGTLKDGAFVVKTLMVSR